MDCTTCKWVNKQCSGGSLRELCFLCFQTCTCNGHISEEIWCNGAWSSPNPNPKMIWVDPVVILSLPHPPLILLLTPCVSDTVTYARVLCGASLYLRETDMSDHLLREPMREWEGRGRAETRSSSRSVICAHTNVDTFEHKG